MKQRFYSLDVFRGATVALMILVNNPGSWNHIYAPLEHAPWHGCTPTDLVFPFFLFAVGNALAFVMPRVQEEGSGKFWKKVLKRSASIFLIGLFLNWLPFVYYDPGGQLVFKTWSHVRILGVLQRIALCYFFASVIIYYFRERGAFLAGLILLLIYWALCIAFGELNDPFSLNGWFGTRIDKAILGENHMYHGEGVAFDPEGIMSTLPAIVQVIFGYMVGNYIIKKGKSYEMVSNLFLAGSVLVFTGYCWDMIFPINKKIWTSSYVVYTTGLAIIILAVLIHIIEFWNRRGWWSKFFDVFGKNPLFIFALSAVVVKTYLLFRIKDVNSEGKVVYNNLAGWMYDHIFLPAFGAMNGSLFYAIFHIIIFWLLARLLDKKKIYIKV
ncbi:MAG: DUF5009 domain-containing protein [Bacteroidetes bacterium]|nr:MAG: DUF5009 domain-containing protein [Bacteroidota bacterium]